MRMKRYQYRRRKTHEGWRIVGCDATQRRRVWYHLGRGWATAPSDPHPNKKYMLELAEEQAAENLIERVRVLRVVTYSVRRERAPGQAPQAPQAATTEQPPATGELDEARARWKDRALREADFVERLVAATPTQPEPTLVVTTRIKVPSIAQMRSYLESKGWTREAMNHGWEFWTLRRDHLIAPSLEVPTVRAADIAIRTMEVVRDLAYIEDRDELDIALDMLEQPEGAKP